MKKLLFIISAMCTAFMINAQSITFKKDGSLFSLVSPNGKYFAGYQDGAPSFFYDLEKDEIKAYQPDKDHGYFITAVSNAGNMYGSMEQKAAFCRKGDDKWQLIAVPDSLSEADLAMNTITAVSEDERNLVLSFSMEPLHHYYYTLKDDGSYDMQLLPVPEKDPIYKMKPQWIKITDMSLDGKRIVGMYLTSDGQRHLPLVWDKGESDKWSYRFLATKGLLQEGKTVPPYPYEWEDPEEGMPYEKWEEWIDARDKAESGLYYRLFGIGISGNGKYLSLNVGIQMPGEAYGSIYGGVIDVDRDTLVVFKSVKDAACMTVSDEGEAMLGTPSVEYFRWGFVGDVNNPDTAVTLRNWVLKKTMNKIDLGDYMYYQINENGTHMVAEGSAALSKDGRTLLTVQNNLLETGQWECFFISFDAETKIENIENMSELILYPNPTTGIIYLSEGVDEAVVYDLTGRRIMSYGATSDVIDLSTLELGEYIIKMSADGIERTEKILIK